MEFRAFVAKAPHLTIPRQRTLVYGGKLIFSNAAAKLPKAISQKRHDGFSFLNDGNLDKCLSKKKIRLATPALWLSSPHWAKCMTKSKFLETAWENYCTHTSAPRHVPVPRSRNFSDWWNDHWNLFLVDQIRDSECMFVCIIFNFWCRRTELLSSKPFVECNSKQRGCCEEKEVQTLSLSLSLSLSRFIFFLFFRPLSSRKALTLVSSYYLVILVKHITIIIKVWQRKMSVARSCFACCYRRKFRTRKNFELWRFRTFVGIRCWNLYGKNKKCYMYIRGRPKYEV